MSDSKTEYLLTTSETEDQRLKRQHDLWLEDARSLWRRARFSREQNILEMGSGPGYSTLDLARYIGDSCRLSTVELSPRFAKACEARLKKYPQVKVINADLHQLNLAKEQFDAVYGRWIWMFLPDPEKVLKKILSHLKPGGVLTFQEYVDYRAIGLSPGGAIHDVVNQAVMKSMRDAGGNPDIVKQLIPLLRNHGLEIELLESNGKLIQTHEPNWDWPTQFYRSFLPTLEGKNYLTTAQVEEFEAAWQTAEKTPGAFWISPTVASVIARKPRY